MRTGPKYPNWSPTVFIIEANLLPLRSVRSRAYSPVISILIERLIRKSEAGNISHPSQKLTLFLRFSSELLEYKDCIILNRLTNNNVATVYPIRKNCFSSALAINETTTASATRAQIE